MIGRVVHHTGHISADTRPHQLYWGDKGMGMATSCPYTESGGWPYPAYMTINKERSFIFNIAKILHTSFHTHTFTVLIAHQFMLHQLPKNLLAPAMFQTSNG